MACATKWISIQNNVLSKIMLVFPKHKERRYLDCSRGNDSLLATNLNACKHRLSLPHVFGTSISFHKLSMLTSLWFFLFCSCLKAFLFSECLSFASFSPFGLGLNQICATSVTRYAREEAITLYDMPNYVTRWYDITMVLKFWQSPTIPDKLGSIRMR